MSDQAMTVAGLRKALSALPDDLPVLVYEADVDDSIPVARVARTRDGAVLHVADDGGEV